jgi:phytoene dehydrogenase-like protein
MSQTKSLRTVRIPPCTLPVVAEADVIVVGGGNAGFIAAIAAARSGAHTILVERYGYLGGCLTGTYAAEPGFFGDSDGNWIIRGIGWEFVEYSVGGHTCQKLFLSTLRTAHGVRKIIQNYRQTKAVKSCSRRSTVCCPP